MGWSELVNGIWLVQRGNGYKSKEWGGNKREDDSHNTKLGVNAIFVIAVVVAMMIIVVS